VTLCEVCGNEIIAGSQHCRYCGSCQNVQSQRKFPFTHKRINLELGRPVAEVAIKRLLTEISQAHLEKVQVLTVIHGYGSSGKGGVIREECRKMLDYLKGKREIKEFIAGENFTRKSGKVKQLIQQFPKLERDENLNKGNRGITLVVL
jgi:DNA-nicking Smr family endonuclease